MTTNMVLQACCYHSHVFVVKMFFKNSLSYRPNLFKILSDNYLLTSQHLRSTKTESSRPSIDHKSKSNDDNDYLGISQATTHDVAGVRGEQTTITTTTTTTAKTTTTTQSTQDIINKYKDLIGKRDAKENEEKIHITSFGRIRFDNENVTKKHGQYEMTNQRLKAFNFNSVKFKLNDNENIENEGQTNFANQTNYLENNNNENNLNNLNLIEEQFFGDVHSGEKIELKKEKESVIELDDDLSLIDKQYFEQQIKPLYKDKINFKFSDELNQMKQQIFPMKHQDENDSKSRKEYDKFNFEKFEYEMKGSIENNSLFPPKYQVDYDYIEQAKHEHQDSDETDTNKNINFEQFCERQEKFQNKQKSDDEFIHEKKTASQYLNELQQGKLEPQINVYKRTLIKSTKNIQKLDSKGFRILKDQVIDFTKLTNEDIVELLVESILFDDQDILVINKPYGLTCQGVEETASGPILNKFLNQLAHRVHCEKLFTVHRLDKETTGILILAKSKEKAKILSDLFFHNKILKQYWCITKSVPEPNEGIIDIPIEVGSIDGKQRMALRPEMFEEARRISMPFKNAKRAVTHYKVLDQNGNAALVEVRPETGIKHQIRVHLGFGLRCPILGDHKYSYLDKLVPQKLPDDILINLKIRQSKARYVPLHLHSRQICISHAGAEGRNIYVNAPLPSHFIRNMASLKLKKL